MTNLEETKTTIAHNLDSIKLLASEEDREAAKIALLKSALGDLLASAQAAEADAASRYELDPSQEKGLAYSEANARAEELKRLEDELYLTARSHGREALATFLSTAKAHRAYEARAESYYAEELGWTMRRRRAGWAALDQVIEIAEAIAAE